jgi:mono/diheme cytochrome c family protein
MFGRAQRGGPFGTLLSLLPAVGLFGALLVRRSRGLRVVVRLARRSTLALLALLGSGCGAPEDDQPAKPMVVQGVGGASGGAVGASGAVGAPVLPSVTHPDPELLPLGMRAETIERVCARGHGDGFAKLLCSSGEPPALRGLADLLELVGLGPSAQRAFALTGNSTSLVSMSVSALNPRILVFPAVGDELEPPETMTAIGFVRGEPFVELVSRDPVANELDFYLFVFEQACSYTSEGCDLASLLTDAIERDWTAYSVYDEAELEATSFDCMSCHQPGGAGTKRILRMQELASPWTHWFPQRFVQRTESDRVLLAQFAAMHDVDATYGGIPVEVITGALDEGSGAQLEALVRAEGFGDQPNPFDPSIAQEIQSGSSPTWQARFDAHLRGEAIAVPYPLIDVTDEAKRTAAVRSYQDAVRGVAPRDTLLDVRQVFSDDAAQKLSFVPLPGADGKTVLLEMCARCHDGRGNPALGKNAFDVLRLDALPRTIKDVAIARINASDSTAMPPWRVGKLTPEALNAATLELQK